MSATQKDIENVEAWAEVIADVLYNVPRHLRSEVLAIATAENAREKPLFINAVELMAMDKPGVRHWNAIQRLQSLMVQIFVRDISNNNSPKDAARILYTQQRYGNGSCRLRDYLPATEAASCSPTQ